MSPEIYFTRIVRWIMVTVQHSAGNYTVPNLQATTWRWYIHAFYRNFSCNLAEASDQHWTVSSFSRDNVSIWASIAGCFSMQSAHRSIICQPNDKISIAVNVKEKISAKTFPSRGPLKFKRLSFWWLHRSSNKSYHVVPRSITKVWDLHKQQRQGFYNVF